MDRNSRSTVEFLGHPAVIAFFVLGIGILAAPLVPGWDRVAPAVVRILIAFLFLLLGAGLWERRSLARRLDELYEVMNTLLYGKNYRADREAIRILLKSLSSKDESIRTEAWVHLKRLTGQNFALDPEVWGSWWRVNEKRYARRDRRPEE